MGSIPAERTKNHLIFHGLGGFFAFVRGLYAFPILGLILSQTYSILLYNTKIMRKAKVRYSFLGDIYENHSNQTLWTKRHTC